MTTGPDDIAAEVGAPHSSAVASNVLRARSPEADMPVPELTEVDYLNGFRKTLSEWNSSEDDEAFSKL